MKNILKKAVVAGISLLSLSTAIANETTGNRYGNPVLYHSDISSARAWLDSKAKKAVIIDVRRIEEYVAGHPYGAYSIPFPHITGTPTEPNDITDYIGYDITVDSDVGFLAQDGNDGALPLEDFVKFVESKFPDKDQPIYLVCATGHRSVQAANALAKYGHYTQVRNVWEGYNGQLKYAYTGTVPTTPLIALDLNNDGVVDNNDRDGWAYFQGLPIETKLKNDRLFTPYLSFYRTKNQ